MLNRRGFLAALVGALIVDPERLLWKPGKLISIPKPQLKAWPEIHCFATLPGKVTDLWPVNGRLFAAAEVGSIRQVYEVLPSGKIKKFIPLNEPFVLIPGLREPLPWST